jgi:hypothetical protein
MSARAVFNLRTKFTTATVASCMKVGECANIEIAAVDWDPPSINLNGRVYGDRVRTPTFGIWRLDLTDWLVMRPDLSCMIWRTDEVDPEIEKIEKIVNDACVTAKVDVAPNTHQAINWGDLSCAEVGTMNDGYYVVVEEASHTATDLVDYVQGKLKAAGFDNVYVTTEW